MRIYAGEEVPAKVMKQRIQRWIEDEADLSIYLSDSEAKEVTLGIADIVASNITGGDFVVLEKTSDGRFIDELQDLLAWQPPEPGETLAEWLRRVSQLPDLQ